MVIIAQKTEQTEQIAPHGNFFKIPDPTRLAVLLNSKQNSPNRHKKTAVSLCTSPLKTDNRKRQPPMVE